MADGSLSLPIPSAPPSVAPGPPALGPTLGIADGGATPVAVLVAPRGVLVGGGGEQCGRGKCAAGSAGEEEPCNTARSTASTPPGVAPAAAVAPAAEAAAGGGEGGLH